MSEMLIDPAEIMSEMPIDPTEPYVCSTQSTKNASSTHMAQLPSSLMDSVIQEAVFDTAAATYKATESSTIILSLVVMDWMLLNKGSIIQCPDVLLLNKQGSSKTMLQSVQKALAAT
jgi:hypothetical protein